MRRIAAFLFLIATCIAQAQPSSQLAIKNRSLPGGIAGRSYSAHMLPEGGKGPFVWTLRGSLPPGLDLQAHTGEITGTPNKTGVYKFLVILNDQTGSTVRREFTIQITGELNVKWKQPPTLSGKLISGSVTVSNFSHDTYDLTFIVYAVNEIGKAFALGYERFDFPPSTERDLKFGSEVPNGQYMIHVDAVGEVADRNIIRRSYLETPQRIVVNVNR